MQRRTALTKYPNCQPEGEDGKASGRRPSFVPRGNEDQEETEGKTNQCCTPNDRPGAQAEHLFTTTVLFNR
jgi:hypothetical protein